MSWLFCVHHAVTVLCSVLTLCWSVLCSSGIWFWEVQCSSWPPIQHKPHQGAPESRADFHSFQVLKSHFSNLVTLSVQLLSLYFVCVCVYLCFYAHPQILWFLPLFQLDVQLSCLFMSFSCRVMIKSEVLLSGDTISSWWSELISTSWPTLPASLWPVFFQSHFSWFLLSCGKFFVRISKWWRLCKSKESKEWWNWKLFAWENLSVK